MGDTVIVETPIDEVVSIVTVGPQGPSGSEAATLTTTGDLLYRAALANDRLPIGSEGQVLKVASGLPAWGNQDQTITINETIGGGADIAANAGRSTQYIVSVTSGGGGLILPRSTDGAVENDKLFLYVISMPSGSNLVVRQYIYSGGVYLDSLMPVATVSSPFRRATFVFNGFSWSTVEVDQHTHPISDIVSLTTSLDGKANSAHTHAASDITSGTLTHERGGLEADVSAYDGLVKISGGSTSAVTVTTAGEALLDDADAAAQRTTLGLGNSATLDTGTTAGTVAAGDHTHTQLHDRSHAITSTSDHTAGNHKVFYSNGSGEVVELALGDSGKVLQSNGATSAPTWETPSGGVSAIGTSAADILSVSGSDIVADDAGADRIVFWDDSESKLAYLEAGSGLSISGTTITATASGGSKTYAVFTASDGNQPPASNYATLDTRNSVACLDFDDATDENAVFVGIIPEGASLGSGLKIRIHWAATTATSGDVRWDVSLERMTTDLDSDSFDTVGSATTTASGTSGILVVTEIALTTIDSVTAGDGFRLKVTRDANNGADTMSGDCELFLCEVRSAA